MLPDDQVSEKSREADFMLIEYERLLQLTMDENKQTEQRVNFFLAIVTAVVAGLIILSQSATITNDFFLNTTLGALIILFLFGIKILNRLNMRVIQIRAFKKVRKEIQSYFLDSNNEKVKRFRKVQDEIYNLREPKFGKFASIIAKVAKLVGKGESGKEILLRKLKVSATLNSVIVLSNGLLVGGITLIMALLLEFELSVRLFLLAALSTFMSMRVFLKYNKFFIENQLPWE